MCNKQVQKTSSAEIIASDYTYSISLLKQWYYLNALDIQSLIHMYALFFVCKLFKFIVMSFYQ